MTFIKKYSSLLLPSGLVLVAAAFFVPTILLKNKIAEKIDQSISLGRQADALLRDVVSEKELQQVKEYQDKYLSDVNDIVRLTVESSQRDVISGGIFPEPNEISIQIFNIFSRNYKSSVDKLLKQMNALDCPSAGEIKKVIPRAQVQPAAGGKAGSGGVVQLSSGSDQSLLELLCRQRADSISVYADPFIFSGYTYWDTFKYSGPEQAVEDCWYYQVAYWIQEDISQAIAKVNKDSAGVPKSAVKRLLEVKFQSDRMVGAADKPVYVTSFQKGMVVPWTGRICNADIDVVHFGFSVIASSKSVLGFMKELCSEKEHTFSGYSGDQTPVSLKHNQITILKSEIQPINPSAGEHFLYRYGDEAVVNLHLVCEYIFVKSGYDKIMPESVKKSLVQSGGKGGRR